MNEHNGTFSYLTCEMRDLVLPWQNTLRIYHYPVAQESITKRGPENVYLPFWKFLRLSKFQVQTKDLIMKDTEIYDWTLSPCWDEKYILMATPLIGD